MLYGRTAEIATIDALIARARTGAGAALVLRGEAGAGKTALLDLAATRGGDMRVLRTAGVEPESDLAFAALHQLLRPVAGLLEPLPVPQRDAVRGALGLAATASGDRFLLAAGVLSLLAEAAAPGGLVCVVDDFQWVDRASADALLFAARRLGTEPIAMLFAVRDDAAPVKGVPSVQVSGLPEAAAAELLDASLAHVAHARREHASGTAVPASRAHGAMAAGVRRELVALTTGNPLALRETARLLTPGQLAGREALPDPLPGGIRLFGDQVAALSAPARLVALLAALESDLDLITRAAAQLSTAWRASHRPQAPDGPEPPPEPGTRHALETPHDVEALGGLQALGELEAAGIARVSGASVRFRHPLIRSAVYEAATPAGRREAHRVLAGLADGDRRAWHLAGAALGQDETVAAALAGTAARARDRGGFGDAATALVRAAELTPDPLTRAVRLKDAAIAAWLGGRPGQAESLLAESREHAGRNAALATEIAQLRGRFELNSGNAAEALRILTADAPLTPPHGSATPPTEPGTPVSEPGRTPGTPASEPRHAPGVSSGEPERTPGMSSGEPERTPGMSSGEPAHTSGASAGAPGDGPQVVPPVVPGVTLGMLADAWEAASNVGDTAAIVEIGRRAAEFPEGFLRDVIVGVGAMLSDGTGHDLLRRALGRVGEVREAAGFLWGAAAASYLGEADLSAELIGRAGRVARMSGMVGQLPVVLEYVATAERIAGRLAESQAVSEEGLELAREAGYANTVAAHLANLAVLAALRGDEEQCRGHAKEALAIAVPHRVGLRAGVASYALAMLDLGLGRFASAHDRFAALVTAGPGAGHPTVVWRSTPDRIEAAVGAGEMESAGAALEAYERWSAHAGTVESRALLGRCRALVRPEGGPEGLAEALRLHANPFEAARTALLLGERLRRTHRPGEARAHLRMALETFQWAGATPWARRAHGELRAAGETQRIPSGPVRPPSGPVRTPSGPSAESAPGRSPSGPPTTDNGVQVPPGDTRITGGRSAGARPQSPHGNAPAPDTGPQVPHGGALTSGARPQAPCGGAPTPSARSQGMSPGGSGEPPVEGRSVLDVLTPQELRIAGLVADGLSSKEIAAQLFLSPRTVEYHLYKIYPKLGIGTRTELTRLVVLRKAPVAAQDML
ncbi:regulatory protein, luxR family [Nonomuraea solani]|uniref:Regulatory protein, luxR family n=1 Tax=Nonomuraea solani TaxID=1144553 RepID=A0A1H5YZC3_9ACTN|nr:AAA family ATPase [Nonomuraea solani]SEG29603.1 regulatory protein, luxR family [Nonomuraea solani]